MKLWKKVTIICGVIAVALFALYFFVYLGDTDFGSSYKSHVQKVMQMEQTNLDSPISGIRTGVYRKASSLGMNEFECTDDGIYYTVYSLPCKYTIDSGKVIDSYCDYIFFCPHDSDTMIKLCGRPDCTHNTLECNAAFPRFSGGGITYFDGHLYVIADDSASYWLPALWRMNLDGSGRKMVLQSSELAFRYDTFTAPYFQHGIFGLGMTTINPDTKEGLSYEEIYFTDWYYCNLRKNGKKFLATSHGKGWNDGFAFLGGSSENADGEEDGKWHLYSWDPDTDTETQLVELPGEYIDGYWGADAGYYFQDGAVIKVNYPDGDKEVLFDTGLTGLYKAQFFPDCISMIENKEESGAESAMMYFYSWEGEKLGEVEIDFYADVGIGVYGGESKDRIMLRSSYMTNLPEYYIEKSDFGTGHIELHKFKYPDLDENTYRQLFGED